MDSSVWIEFLRATRSSHQAHLAELIRWFPERIQVPGPTIQEVLQGVRDEALFRLVHARLLTFTILLPDPATYVVAAELYQRLLRHGKTIPPGDATIAALAIQHRAELYTLDRKHFEPLSQQSPLRLYRLPT